MIYLLYLIAGALIMGLGIFTGAYLYYRAEKKESPVALKMPGKKHKVKPPLRDEDINDT